MTSQILKFVDSFQTKKKRKISWEQNIFSSNEKIHLSYAKDCNVAEKNSFIHTDSSISKLVHLKK